MSNTDDRSGLGPRTARYAGFLVLAVVSCLLPAAADWPQWRGPQRNGLSSETGWLKSWGPGGPRRLWTARVGEGWSAVAVRDGRVFTMGNSTGQDHVTCLDAATGRPVWRYSYAAGSGDYGGPRATPTLEGEHVYTLNRAGKAFCLNAGTGKLVWTVDLRRETRGEEPRWGFAGSPLIQGNLALYNVGTAGVALDRLTGRVVWKSGPETAGYASPVSYSINGQRGAAFFVAWGIVALNPENGKPFWQHPWDTTYGVNAADPIFAGDTVFISSGYGRGGALLKVSGSRPQVIWENRNMKNHFNSCVLVGGALYGNDENTLKCIDLRSGAERWRMRGMGKGGLIAADGHLIVLTERGELLLVKAVPDSFQEVARAQVLRGTCWTHPVLADGRIYCRSHEGELAALDVRSSR